MSSDELAVLPTAWVSASPGQPGAHRFTRTDFSYLSSKMTDVLTRRPVTKFINTQESQYLLNTHQGQAVPCKPQ